MTAKIRWRSWDKASFDKAKKLDRPVLLAISAAWCHWCHVMDETTYSDPAVASAIADKFIPVRVDNDRRPDLNRRYNMGGWPTTAILTPEGKIITGTTYEPPESMVQILNEAAEFYRNKKSRPAQQSKKRPAAAPGNELPITAVEEFLRAARARYDPRHGGFGFEPKFPMADALDAVLEIGFDRQDQQLIKIAADSLRHMASGEIFDDVAGGFFRYATRDDWSAPHFEKMLEDNAKLLKLYLRAYQVTNSAEFLAVARRIFDYINETLRGGQSFFGSQAADETYYFLSGGERAQRRPPAIDETTYIDWNALAVSSYLLFAAVTGVNDAYDFSLEALDHIWIEGFSPEKGIAHYLIDGKPMLSGLLNDQALMIETFIDAYENSGNENHIGKAVRLAEFIESKLWDGDSGIFVDRPADADLGKSGEPSSLIAENANTAIALTRLGRLTGRSEFLASAKRCLLAQANYYPEYGFLASAYIKAVNLMAKPAVDVSIIGEEPLAGRLLRAVQTRFTPRRSLRLGKQALDKIKSDTPGVYICVDGRCLKPAGTARDIARELKEAASY